MSYKLGSICHIEMAGGNIAEMKEFYARCFGWTFSPMNDTYEFFDAGNAQGALDSDAKPSHDGTVLVLACEDVEAKLKEIEADGCKVLKPKTEIGGDHGWYGYFEDPAGNKMGVWQPKGE
ncbi:MAG: VOC family protein [Planctomycetes bacterium]|nr:VOC family protein [Planctomycetota bacterium]MCA8945034.1 VOC family protein [Planctomycetota bacterium]